MISILQTWTMIAITFAFIIAMLSLFAYFRYGNMKNKFAHSTNSERLTSIVGEIVMYVVGITTNQGTF